MAVTSVAQHGSKLQSRRLDSLAIDLYGSLQSKTLNN